MPDMLAHGLQVAASIKAQKPEWRISWIVRDIFAPLVRSSSAVDRVFVFQRHEGARGFLRMMREVRKHEFDLVCDFQGLLRTGLMTFRAHGRRKVTLSSSWRHQTWRCSRQRSAKRVSSPNTLRDRQRPKLLRITSIAYLLRRRL